MIKTNKAALQRIIDDIKENKISDAQALQGCQNIIGQEVDRCINDKVKDPYEVEQEKENDNVLDFVPYELKKN